MKLAVEIEVRQTGNGLEVTNNGLKQIINDAPRAAAGIESVFSGLASIATISSAFAIVGEGLKTGVQFNALLETSRLGIGALVDALADLKDANGKALEGQDKFNRSMQVARTIQQDLKVAARETGATYEELVRAIQEGVGPAIRAGFNSKQIVDFTKQITQAAGAIGLPFDQLGQEIRGVFEGDLSRMSRISRLIFQDFAGNAAGLRAKMEELGKQGKLADFLADRFRAFSKAGEESLNTFDVALSNFHDNYQQAMGEGTQELTKGLTAVLNELSEKFFVTGVNGKKAFDPALLEAIKNVADAAAKVVRILADMIGWLVKLNQLYHEMNAATPETPASVKAMQDRLKFQQEQLRMGQWTADERKQREGDIAKLQQMIEQAQKQVFPTTDAGKKQAEDYFRQLTKGAKLENFPNIADAGQQLIDLAQKDAPRYLAVTREIAKATKDGKLTQLELAVAYDKVRRAMEGAIDLGKYKASEDDKAAKREAKRLEALRQLLAAIEAIIVADNRALGNAGRLAQMAQADQDIAGIRAQIQNTETSLLLKHEDVLTRVLVLQQQLTNAETAKARITTAQQLADEDYRYLDAQKKLNELREKLALGVKLKTIHGGAFKPDGSLDEAKLTGEALQVQRKLNEATEQAAQVHEANIANITARGEADITAIVIAGNQKRIETANQLWLEHVKYVAELYERLGDALAQSLGDAFDAIAHGRGLKGIASGFADAVRSALGGAITHVVQDWMAEFRKHALGQPEVRDDKGNVIQQGIAGDSRSKYAYGGLQGAAILYGLYQNGQAGASPRGNAAAGAAQGAMLGAQIGGVYGAVIGGLVGAVAGYVTAGKKAGYTVSIQNGKISIKGVGSASAATADDAARDINKAIESTVAGVFAIFDAFPAAIAEQMKRLSPEEIFKDADLGTVDVKKGQSGFSKFFTFIDPMLKKLRDHIHQTEGSLSGDALKHFIEIDVPNMVFDAYAPILQGGLRDLGVTEGKLKELFDKVPGFDPKEQLQKILDFVTVVVGFVNAKEFTQLSGSDLMARAVEQLQQTPQQKIADISDQIRGLRKGFEDLSSDEQVTRGKKILDLEQQREDMILQFLLDLKTTGEAVFKSINEQLNDIAFGELGAFAQRDALSGQLGGAIGRLGQATTPQELQEAASDAQAAIARRYELTKQLRAGLGDLIKGFADLDASLAPDKSPAERLTELATKMADASATMAKSTNPDEQLAKGQELLDLAQDYYALHKQLLEDLAAATKEINNSITKQIHDFRLQGQITAIEGDNSLSDAEKKRQIGNLTVKDLLEQQRSLRDQLTEAGSAAEVQRIVSEMQANASSLFDAMGKTPEAANQLTNMLEDVRKLSNERLKKLTDDVHASDALIQEMLKNAAKSAQDALGTLPDAAEEARAALTALREAMAARIHEIVDAVAVANQGLLADVGDILDLLRNGLQDIFGTPPATAPGGSKGDPIDPAVDKPWKMGPDDYRSAPQEPPPMNVSIPQPFVNVNIMGGADRALSWVAAEAGTLAAQQAVGAVQQAQGRRAGR